MSGTRWRNFVLKGNYDSSRGICHMPVNPKVLNFVLKNQPCLFLISGKNNLLHGKILIEIWHFLLCKVIGGWKRTWQPPFFWNNQSIIVPLLFLSDIPNCGCLMFSWFLYLWLFSFCFHLTYNCDCFDIRRVWRYQIIKMSIFPWYLVLFSFFQEINADSHKNSHGLHSRNWISYL